MLRLEKYGKIFVDGDEAENLGENKSEFIKGALMLEIELSEDLTVGDAVHFFYEAQDVIKTFFLEEYEVVRALSTSSRLPRPYKRFECFKSFKFESDDLFGGDEYIYMLPEISVIESEEGEDGFRNIAALPLVINNEVVLERDGHTIIKSKAKITLYELMTCLFDELPALLKDGLILAE